MTLCNGAACQNEANLQCPTCIKLGIEKMGFFCSQECFKSNWLTHKNLHNKPVDVQAKPLLDLWPWFKFTGPLRPFEQTPLSSVPDHIERPDYRPKTLSTAYNSIKILDASEQQSVRESARIGRIVLDYAATFVKVGVTTDRIDQAVHEKCIELGAYPSPLFYRSFPKSCCTSVNEVICHGIPDKRPLNDGDIVNIDVSVFYHGFHADLNETYLVGSSVDDSGKRLVDCARDCLEKAIAIVKPGVAYRKLGDEIEKHAKSCGFSVVRSYCGHGIHKFFHAAPNVPHYSNNKAVGIMKAGHCFTIEPMINEGSWKDVTWPDNWTSTTIDGKRSAQFEHMLLVTETGCEVLTR